MNALQELLADGIRYGPCYLPSMNSNHLPMTLCAITGLGGDVNACVAFQDEYQDSLQEIPPENPITHWRRGIGRAESYASLLAWFQEEVAAKGIDSTVSEYLPEFIGSLALEAFHPIIRLGYAIDFASEAETAAALAYLVSSHQDVPVQIDRAIDLSKVMQRQAAAAPRLAAELGFSRCLRELLAADEYPVGHAADFGECAAIALDIYRSTRNFFALHMVTATQAVRICSEFIEGGIACAALTGGLLAAHLVVGSPDFARSHVLPIPDKLDKAHAYKYAWACLSEYRHYADVRYSEEIQSFRESGLIAAWCARDEV